MVVMGPFGNFFRVWVASTFSTRFSTPSKPLWGRFGKPKGYQNGAKMDPKCSPKWCRTGLLIRTRFLNDFLNFFMESVSDFLKFIGKAKMQISVGFALKNAVFFGLSHYQRARFDDARNASTKPSKNISKICKNRFQK